MTDRQPPFRADHVGSLLRPPELVAARAKFASGALDAVALRAVEDQSVAAVIVKQEAVGLRGITDGEYRRSMWHFDFLREFDGVEEVTAPHGIKFQGDLETKPVGLRVNGRITYGGHSFIDDFDFVRSRTHRIAKQTIPSPSVLHFRGGRPAISTATYPDLGPFFADLGNAFADVVEAFADAGCRYLQLDDTNFAYLCDPEQCEASRARGDNPDALPAIYAKLINGALSTRPADMRVTMHLCRGNFRSSWISSGGYEPVAECLFNDVNVDGYFLEYDSDRAGNFEPLRFVPKNKVVVLGLITSKSGALESPDVIRRRIDEAAKFVPLDQICLSPQCGFASTEEGNLLTEDQQWRKLDLTVQIADAVWGGN